MLQQTRVEAVIPFYLAFLARFPDAASLAAAPEAEVLAAWAGLGYYSRARNLRRAAEILATVAPAGYEEILCLPGVGPYTAAALASIALGQPWAAVDGNVLRVVSRLTNDPSEIGSGATKRRFTETAQGLLSPSRPGDFNQAMMELGATVCLPTNPRCLLCPVAQFCAARQAGTQAQLPVKLGKPAARRLELHLLRCSVGSSTYLVKRSGEESRLADFWELPQKPAEPPFEVQLECTFSHQIVNDRFQVHVWGATLPVRPDLPGGGNWFEPDARKEIPVTTITRKALTRRNLNKSVQTPC